MPPTRVRPPLLRPPLLRPPLLRIPRTPQGLASDAGFTVLEALVSFVLLAVVGAATITAIVTATRTSKNSTDRVNASDLAQQDQQDARSLRYPSYPAAITAHPVTLGPTTYQVSRTVTSPCPARPDYDGHPYMLVTSTVTWPPATPASTVVMATELAC